MSPAFVCTWQVRRSWLLWISVANGNGCLQLARSEQRSTCASIATLTLLNRFEGMYEAGKGTITATTKKVANRLSSGVGIDPG